MNALAANFALLTRTLGKLTAEPRCADLFEWCQETNNWPTLPWSLSALNVSFEPSERVADLAAKIERKLVQERGKKERAHWAYDANRAVAYRQMLATIEQFNRRSGAI